MSNEPLFIIPQHLRDELKLPDGYYWRNEDFQYYASLMSPDESFVFCFIHRVALRWNGTKEEMLPPDMSDEEIIRYAYSKWLLGENHD